MFPYLGIFAIVFSQNTIFCVVGDNFFIGPKSDHCLAQSVSPRFEFSSDCWIFFEVVTWICQNCYMDFSKLLHGFVRIGTWIVVTQMIQDYSTYIPCKIKFFEASALK